MIQANEPIRFLNGKPYLLSIFLSVWIPFYTKFSEVLNRQQILSDKTFVSELDRIYAGKVKSNATGHPMHYIIQTDDHNVGFCFKLCIPTGGCVASDTVSLISDMGTVSQRQFSIVFIKAALAVLL